MESIIRGTVIFLFLLVVFRISGKRTLAESTNFDFVLLLIISEVTQQAMVDSDHSITNAMILIVTLVGLDLLLSILKQHNKTLEKVIDGEPIVILQKGRALEEPMGKERVSEEDILAAARATRGLERMDQVKYAILESNGKISIIPAEPHS